MLSRPRLQGNRRRSNHSCYTVPSITSLGIGRELNLNGEGSEKSVQSAKTGKTYRIAQRSFLAWNT